MLRYVKTLNEYVAEQLWQPRQSMTLLAIFGAIAVVLAMAGVYGIMACAVRQRTQEIGIRMATAARNRARPAIGRIRRRDWFGRLARPDALLEDHAVGTDAGRSFHLCTCDRSSGHGGYPGVLSSGAPGLTSGPHGRFAV